MICCEVVSAIVSWPLITEGRLPDKQYTACKHGYVSCMVVEIVHAYCCSDPNRLSVVGLGSATCVMFEAHRMVA